MITAKPTITVKHRILTEMAVPRATLPENLNILLRYERIIRLILPRYMEKILLVDKPPGITPLQTIECIRDQYPDYANKKLSYAGRLDPMAEGLLILLIGDENKKREEYLQYTKVYSFSILCDVSSDTYDVMGRITPSPSTSHLHRDTLDTYLGDIKSLSHLPYPPYSSKTVNGKPLHWYASNNLLSTITMPDKQISIKTLDLLSVDEVPNEVIYSSIQDRIQRVQGNFRQMETLSDWNNFFTSKITPTMCLIHCKAEVSSGTYIRSIVNELGKRRSVPMITYSIRRTQIGSYTLDQALTVQFHPR